MSYATESDIRVKSYDHSNLSRASVVHFQASWWVMSANRTSCEKLWPFEFLKCFRCWISSVSIFYVLESDIRVKCYDQSNLSRAFVIQFRASRWVMSTNRTSCEKFRPFEFLEWFRCSISRVSIFYVLESDIQWNAMTIGICRELPLLNFELLDILCPRIGHLCEEIWAFEFLESFRCSISSVSIYYVPESDIRVKCYDHWNLSRASVVQFRASRYILSPNRTTEWNIMTIRICRELPLFNFERLDELCHRIGHPC